MPSDPSSATKASLDASARYIEEKKVYELFEGLMADLLIKKPNDPIAHMISSLKQPPRPRVFVFGPPGADTQSQCELISSKLGLVHVVPKAVWREAAKGGSEAGASAKALEDAGKEVPLELQVAMLGEKLGGCGLGDVAAPHLEPRKWIRGRNVETLHALHLPAHPNSGRPR